jgi:hypothetical protein
MKRGLFVTMFSVVVFNGCTNNRAIAMNEYKPVETTKLSGATVTITPKMIKDVQQRRANFLKSHIIE